MKGNAGVWEKALGANDLNHGTIFHFKSKPLQEQGGTGAAAKIFGNSKRDLH